MVSSPWVYSPEACARVIENVPDLGNLVFRNECNRTMGQGVPDQVANAYVDQCVQLTNGTIRYRSFVCCPGKNQVLCADGHFTIP